LRFMAPVRLGDRVRVMLGPGTGGGEPEPWRHAPPPGGPRPQPGHPPPGPPPPWQPPQADGGPPPGPPPLEGGPPPGPPPPPTLIVEFEPVEAQQMALYARRTLTVGIIATPLFMLGGVLLAIVVKQRDALAQRLEHQRRLAALGEMAAVIAHEIRNPLTSLKGHAQLLEKSLGGDARGEKAQRVVADAVRLDALVGDLLDFARTGALAPRHVDPARILRECADAVQPERIVVHTETAPTAWNMDPERMCQALTNVLRNAVQMSPPDAAVEASAAVEDGRLVFEVRDRGPGIEPGDEERVFEPFYTRKTRGTGLGLALARRIVAQHHGTISAHNDPQGGACFRIALEKV